MGSKSPRSAAVYQKLAAARRQPPPTRSALGATQAVSRTTGVTPARVTITSVHQDRVARVHLGGGHLATDPRHEREEYAGHDEGDDAVDQVVRRVTEAAH